jgi:hypothetical protein
MDMQIQKASAELERPLRIEDVLEQVGLIQKIMQNVMKKDEHYGVIPGTPKPSLYKPGAEKICFTFRLAPEYEVIEREMEHGHREYRVCCTLRTVTGRSVGQGVGSCSTMESRYRFRTGPRESTGKPVPHEYWNMRKTDPAKALELIGGKGHVVAKEDGIWQIAIQGEKVENDNIADAYNTVLKMAKKRAHVDAVLTATAASDIFTQDVEEIAENLKVVTHENESEERPLQAKAPIFGEETFKQAKAAMAEGDATKPADWTEVGVYFGADATEAQKSFEGVPLGELRRDQLEWAYKWMEKRMKSELTLAVTPRERAMIDGLLAWKRSTRFFEKAKPMTGQDFQKEQERQQAEAAAEEFPAS